MSTDTLRTESVFEKDHFVLTGEVVTPEVLPLEVFLFENKGTTSLGDYCGICAFSELIATKVFTGEPIPILHNKYVRYGQAKIKLYSEDEVTAEIQHMASSLKSLVTEIQNQGSQTVLTPVG
jgi:hypothetical protein